MRRGYTVAEVLIVVGLAMILAAITFPVFRRAVDRSKEMSCVSNLRTLAVALEMYRSDHDGHGKYGTPREMGMPPAPYLGAYMGPVECSGVSHLMVSEKPLYGFAWNGFDDHNWAQHVWKYKDGSVVFTDENHGNRREDFGNPYAMHRGIAAYLDTHVRTLAKRGYITLEWWQQTN